MIEDCIHRYNSLLERELFFEAHEELESLWIDVKKSDVGLANLLKGYINATTTFVLFQKGRSVYVNTWATYKKYHTLKSTQASQTLVELLDKADEILQGKVEKFKLVL